MFAELSRRNPVLEHLVDLGRRSAGDLWEDEISDDTRDGTCSSEASEGG